MEEKDWNLVARQAVADDVAFDELYEHFFPRIYNLIYARVKNAATADGREITACALF
jgi:RNA polymerase sigma-70 factor (ECF subfamily)